MSTNHAMLLQHWREQMIPVMTILHDIAGNTEDQFLQLGEKLQDFALRSASISGVARDLVAIVAGTESTQLTDRLRHLFDEMDAYLNRVNSQGEASCSTLEQIMAQLDSVITPLEGFRKMDKALRMLSISTKIESARLGELGAGFTTLAMDVEKLSQAVSEKSAGIMQQRQSLSHLITNNLEMVRSTEARQFSNARTILTSVSSNLASMEQLNSSCSVTGSQVSVIAEQISTDIATVVSSMQFHDITRQQIEHVIEALEKLQQHTDIIAIQHDEHCPALVAETGDVCELQTAQMRHAADQLLQATGAILESLQDIATKQAQISHSLQQALLGNTGGSETSLLETIGYNMQQVTTILQSCSQADQELATAMQQVSDTVGTIGGFVSDIEAVGSEIDLIALNAQIKAAHTGTQGAALGVLAEAIKRLSLEAVTQTEAVSAALSTINGITGTMANQTDQVENGSLQQVSDMEHEAHQIISSLASINRATLQQLTSLANSAESLADDISSATSSIHVHENIHAQTAQTVQILEQIYREAREQVPASSEFINNLRHMEQRYTMESERMVHEMLAARHGIQLLLQKQESSASGSEFGDNVDLF